MPPTTAVRATCINPCPPSDHQPQPLHSRTSAPSQSFASATHAACAPGIYGHCKAKFALAGSVSAIAISHIRKQNRCTNRTDNGNSFNSTASRAPPATITYSSNKVHRRNRTTPARLPCHLPKCYHHCRRPARPHRLCMCQCWLKPFEQRLAPKEPTRETSPDRSPPTDSNKRLTYDVLQQHKPVRMPPTKATGAVCTAGRLALNGSVSATANSHVRKMPNLHRQDQ